LHSSSNQKDIEAQGDHLNCDDDDDDVGTDPTVFYVKRGEVKLDRTVTGRTLNNDIYFHLNK
jgi:hypothetical protein